MLLKLILIEIFFFLINRGIKEIIKGKVVVIKNIV